MLFYFSFFLGPGLLSFPRLGVPLVLIPQAVPGRWMRGPQVPQAVAVRSSPLSRSPILSRLHRWSQHIWSDGEKRQAALRHASVGSTTAPAAEPALDFWPAVSRPFVHLPDLVAGASLENIQGQELRFLYSCRAYLSVGKTGNKRWTATTTTKSGSNKCKEENTIWPAHNIYSSLFHNCQIWKHPSCPSVGEWINKLVHPDNGIFF